MDLDTYPERAARAGRRGAWTAAARPSVVTACGGEITTMVSADVLPTMEWAVILP
jgi:hypothetical protein